MKSIALIIKTDGLDYDDRVRKEILSVMGLFPDIRFKIFVMLPENKAFEGVTSYGISYKSVYISSRDKNPSSKKTILKAYEFYKALEKEMKAFDAVWAANVDTSFFPLFCRKKRILWDLHELPSIYLTNRLKMTILKYIFNRCRVVIHANPQRKEYLDGLGLISDRSKHFSLRNFPDFKDNDREYDEKFRMFLEWKGNRQCVYLQGLNMDRRAPFESISAVLAFTDLCAVVVGGFDPAIRNKLEQSFAEDLRNRILFVGKIPQLKIPQYVSQCFTTLVFYKNVTPNNYYCEANRFYQSVVLGLPVVVGDNPSMKEIVEAYGFGVAIDDDGSNTNMIIEGLQKVIDNYDEYKNNVIINRDQLIWKKQEPIIAAIVNKLLF